MRRSLLVACLSLVAAAGCEAKPKPIDPAMEPKLQALATSACHCEQAARSKDEEAACWTDYNRAGRASISATYATACAPISSSGDVYNSDTPQEFSIDTGSNSPIGKLCTGGEVRAVETAWQQAFDEGLKGEAMTARMRKALKDFQSGKEVAMTGGGCSG